MGQQITLDWQASRLHELPPYLFVEIDRLKQQAVDAGKDVINLGIGDPDMPTPAIVVDALGRFSQNAENHRYPSGKGIGEFRTACASFMKRRFGCQLDPDKQITALIGSKEGIAHLPLAVVDPGQTVLIPEPGYPVYTASAIFAGGKPHVLPLDESDGWLVDFDRIAPAVADAAKLMFLNYPNNPTSGCADRAFFERAIAFAREHHVLIAHDAAYSEIYFESKPPSILEVDGAADHAVEFHSLSKTFNMTGWRIAFAAGNAGAIDALGRVKNNVDSGQFNAIQQAAVVALNDTDRRDVGRTIDSYRQRRDVVIPALRDMGITCDAPRASFYVWAKCPHGASSMVFATTVLEQAGVVVIPGSGFGQCGEGYFRIALTVPANRLREAMDRMKNVHWD